MSAFCMVESRWAMAIVVRPLAAWSKASWTTFSDCESRAEVASSKRRTFGLRRRARAIAMRSEANRNRSAKQEYDYYIVLSRFCPPESCAPLPPTSVSKPLVCCHQPKSSNSRRTYSGRDLMNSRILALRQTASISSCVTSSMGFVAPNRILKRIVPAYRVLIMVLTVWYHE
jgi:hypothetical protein